MKKHSLEYNDISFNKKQKKKDLPSSSIPAGCEVPINQDSDESKFTTYLRSPHKTEKIFLADSKETAYEKVSNKKFFINCKSEPYHEAKEEGNRNLSAALYGTEEKFYIELAVAAGNIIRLLAGKSHPKYFSVMQKSTNEIRYYRASSAIDNLDETNIFKGLPGADVLENLLTDQFFHNSNLTVLVGSITHLLFAFFLGDDDYKNIGKIKNNDEDIARIIRIDPECCFHYYFLTNHNIYHELSFITNLKLDEEICESYKGFFDSIFTNLIFIGFENEDRPFFDKIFYTTHWRRFEAFGALARIFEISFEEYEKIIDKHISKEFQKQIDILKKYFQFRISCFKEAATRLEGFEQFQKEYLTAGTKIHDFWHKFWGYSQTKNDEQMKYGRFFMPILTKVKTEIQRKDEISQEVNQLKL